MSEPGTKEYQEAYDKEMQRLEAEAGGTEKVEQAATTSDEVKTETKVEAKVETQDDTAQRLEKAEKALKDTQRWAHENAAKVKRLEREATERKHAETRPAILDANPGLEDAIKHVATSPEKTHSFDDWSAQVQKVIPDVNELLEDKAFFAAAAERRKTLGSEWDDPLVASRELSDLKVRHLSNQNAAAAVESARKDFETKSGKRSAMQMPGGGGGKDIHVEKDAAKAVWEMSDADFQKSRAKTLGYT